MIPAPTLPNEDQRVADLLRHNILDTEAETDFDELVQLAAMICGAEIALVSLVDDRRQWFKAKVGLEAQETGVSHFRRFTLIPQPLLPSREKGSETS